MGRIAGALFMPLMGLVESIIRLAVGIFLAIAAFTLACISGLVGVIARIAGKSKCGGSALKFSENCFKFINDPLWIGARDTIAATVKSTINIFKCKG